MMKPQLKKVAHDYIRYANCWEDADVLLEGLQVNEGDRVFSIGSAGDNSFSLLIENPSLVLAVDVNQAQLHLIELKKAAFSALDYAAFLEFLGFKDSVHRKDLFLKIKSHLPLITREYWETNFYLIEDGIIHQGKFERYFHRFKNSVLPLIHSNKKIDYLTAEKSSKHQAVFFNQKWNNWRWKGLFKLFFSRFILGRFGRDPAFLNEVNGSVSEYLLEKTAQHLSSANCQSNPFLNYILTSNFGQNLPHYARAENYDLIKSNIQNLMTFEGLAESAFEKYSQFNCFNLSNIFEYMNPSVFKTVAQTLIENADKNARFAYWNLMVKREMATIIPSIKNDKNINPLLQTKDNGFFYSQVCFDFKTN